MSIFVCSDLHLGDAAGSRLFRDADQGVVLAQLCDQVKAQGGELILGGDIFDITAALPPEKGLAEFARAVGVPEIGQGKRRPLHEVMRAIRENNPRACDALERLADHGALTLVPGNHDRHLGDAEGRAALDAVGLSKLKLEPMAVRHLGEKIAVVQHGHAFDPGNATPQGGGEVMTGVLHHAVLPFLRSLPHRRNVQVDGERLVALRPEERVIPVLERWLPPGLYETFIDAFVELLVANGALSRMLAWMVTSERIRERLKHDDNLWELSGRSALDALAGRRQLPGRPPPPDVLVFGHTHVIDWAVQEGAPQVDPRTGRSGDPVQRLYVNLGTWTMRASDAAGPVDPTLPLLEVTLEPRHLVATLHDQSRPGRPLQRFEVAR